MDPPVLLSHPDTNSSPRSTTSPDENHHFLPPIPNAKLRLMCSYGGHIIPRPHDKSLCYVGGDTRIVVVDRKSSLSDLHSKLSQTLLNGRNFTLKYQLPTEDLDSLISISIDDDLENMIDEYDRTTSTSSLKPSSRLRLFLFPSKPETAASMGCLLDDAKSETWFVDALNGSGLLPRGLSDSATMDNMLELDSTKVEDDSGNELNQQVDRSSVQEVVTAMVDSMSACSLVEMNNSSSFGSSSSSPSMSNLPPIKVRVEEQQMVGDVNVNSQNVEASNLSTIVSDEVKSDHVGTGLRKPPLPLQLVQRKLSDFHNLPFDSKHSEGYSLTSPDSIASDRSTSPLSLSRNALYRVSTPVDQTMININNNNNMDPTSQSSQIPIQHQLASDPSVILPPGQYQNQQVVGTYNHQIPISSSYYPMYLPRQSFTDPQYAPMYYQQTQQPPPPAYTTKPEMAGNLYSTTAGGPGGAPMYVQYPTGTQQYQQQQYMHVSHQIPANYGGYDQVQQDQMYYAAPPPQSQYQTITPATAVMLSRASAQQVPSDNNTPAQ